MHVVNAVLIEDLERPRQPYITLRSVSEFTVVLENIKRESM